MKRFIYLLIVAFCFSTCKDEPITKELGTVTLLFKLKYGDKDLRMFENYNYPTGQLFYFSRFSFYISELELKGKNDYVKYLDTDYLNLTNTFSTPATASKGFEYRIENVDVDAYSSVKFNLGVPKISNDKTPANFSSDHILSQQSEYWIDWKSYIFTRTEGQIDLDGNGIPEEGFALHTGNNTALRSIEFPISKTLIKDGNLVINITIDLKKQFGENPIYDIVNDTQIHSSTQVLQVQQLIDNLSKAISVN